MSKETKWASLPQDRISLSGGAKASTWWPASPACESVNNQTSGREPQKCVGVTTSKPFSMITGLQSLLLTAQIPMVSTRPRHDTSPAEQAAAQRHEAHLVVRPPNSFPECQEPHRFRPGSGTQRPQPTGLSRQRTTARTYWFVLPATPHLMTLA